MHGNRYKLFSLVAILGFLQLWGWQAAAGASLPDDYYETVEEAFAAGLASHRRAVAPAEAWTESEIRAAGDWAYLVTQPATRSVTQGEEVFAVLLGHRDPERGWFALSPDTAAPETYNELLQQFPASLLDESSKAFLREPEPGAVVANLGGHRLPWDAGKTGTVTAKDGYRHENQVDFDIEGWRNDGYVVASKPGRVVFVKESSNSGACDFDEWKKANMVVVRHDDGAYSWYVHLAYNSVPVSVGDEIALGTRIGVEGNTGFSCGVHLHYMASTGRTAWTDPADPDNAPWALGIVAVDFDEVSWEEMVRGGVYTSQNGNILCEDGEPPVANYYPGWPAAGGEYRRSSGAGLKAWAEDSGSCASGVDRVWFRAYYQGAWHTIADDEALLDRDCAAGQRCDYEGQWNFNGAPDGQVTVRLDVADRAGNRSAVARSVFPLRVYSNPLPWIAGGYANDVQIGSNTARIDGKDTTWQFSGTAGDDEQVARVGVYSWGNNGLLASTANGTTAWSASRTGLTGHNRLGFYAYDSRGQQSAETESLAIDLYVDAAAPAIGAELNGSLGGDGWFTSPVQVTLLAADEGSGAAGATYGIANHYRAGVEALYYRVDGGAWQRREGASVVVTVGGDGSHVVDYYAVDRVGNESNVSNLRFKVDGTAPTLPGNALEREGTISNQWQKVVGAPIFSWPAATDSLSGVAGYQLYWGPEAGGQGVIWRAETTFDPGEVATGVYYLRARARDSAGNWSDWTTLFTFRYDNVPPRAPNVASAGGVFSGIWQNRVRSADFSWSLPADTGSGIAGTMIGWGTDENGTAGSFLTTSGFSLATPICGEGEVCSAYLRVQSVDNVGLTSEWATAFALRYDGAPPVASLVANGGVFRTSSRTISLDITASDEGSGAETLSVSTDGTTWSAWLPLAETVYWELPPVPGRSYDVLLRVADGAGNVSAVVSDTVFLDIETPPVAGSRILLPVIHSPGTATPPPPGPDCPSYQIAIDEGARYTGDATVTLDLCGPDPWEVRLSNERTFAGAVWQPYTATVSWTLDEAPSYLAPRLVYVQYRDGHDQVHATFFDEILYDPMPPAGSVTVAAPSPEHYRAGALLPGAPERVRVVRERFLTLLLAAADNGSGVAEMQIAETPDFSAATWEPYASFRPWTVSAGDGVKRVYARFRDRAGNISATYSELFILDSTGPVGTATVVEAGAGPATIAVTVATEAADALGTVVGLRAGYAPDFGDSLWLPYRREVTLPAVQGGATEARVYVQFRDDVGNLSAVYTAGYRVDTVPPTGSAIVQAGIGRERTVILQAADDLSGIGEMWLSTDYFFREDVAVLPYTPVIRHDFGDAPVLYVLFVDGAGHVSERVRALLVENRVFLPLLAR